MPSRIEHLQKRCCLCSQATFRVLFNRQFCVLLCRNCGLIFIAHETRNLERYYALEHRLHILAGRGRFKENKRRTRSLTRWVKSEVQNLTGVSVLEIGCSAGFLLKELGRQGAAVSGIEPCLHASGIARSLNGISNIQCCMLEKAAEETKHNVVVLVQTFEHLADPLSALHKIRNLLESDGLLFIEVPNFFSFNGFYRRWIRGTAYPSPNHLFIYTRRTLSAVLRKAGFELCKITTSRNIRVVARRRTHNAEDDRQETAENYHKLIIAFQAMRLFYGAIGLMWRVMRRSR